jgi:hypothetical protein
MPPRSWENAFAWEREPAAADVDADEFDPDSLTAAEAGVELFNHLVDFKCAWPTYTEANITIQMARDGLRELLPMANHTWVVLVIEVCIHLMYY